MIGQKISLYRSIISIVMTIGIKVELYNYRDKEKNILQILPILLVPFLGAFQPEGLYTELG